MVKQAHAQGVDAALARFGVKTALLSMLKQMAIGSPGQVLSEGRKTFAPGGLLHHKNVWWPDVKGNRLGWLARAGTVAAPIMALRSMRSDPHEGRLSNLLGAVGGIAGNAYGFPALGMLGGPTIGAAGARIGRGVGHLLGSRPDPY